MPFRVPVATAVAGGFLHRHTLAGEGGLIHLGSAADYLAVHGDLLTGPHRQPVAHGHLLNGNLSDVAGVIQQVRRRWSQVHQPADGVGRAREGAGLQPSPQQHQRDDNGGHVEVQPVSNHLPRVGREKHQEHRDGAVAVGDAGAQRNQRVHIGLKAAQSGPSRHVERPAGPQLHRRRHRPEQQGIPPEGHQPHSVLPRQRNEAGKQQQDDAAGHRHQQPTEQITFLVAACVGG